MGSNPTVAAKKSLRLQAQGNIGRYTVTGSGPVRKTGGFAFWQFKSAPPDHLVPSTNWLSHHPLKVEVEGSSPSGITMAETPYFIANPYATIAQLAEHTTDNRGVGGSTPLGCTRGGSGEGPAAAGFTSGNLSVMN